MNVNQNGANAHVIERLKKLYALAERGESGEQATAKIILKKLLKKYKISAALLSDETKDYHCFKYKNEFEEKLIAQIQSKNLQDHTGYKQPSGKGSRSEYYVFCTKAEAVQMKIEFEFYKELWQDELKLFFKAFIYKHELFCHTASDDTTSETLSEEEIKRMAAMIVGMQDKTLYPMIEA